MGTIRPRAAGPAHDDIPSALRDCAPWWLGCLGRALAQGDYDAAGEADRELTRLGYAVRIRPTPDRVEAQEAPDASR